MRAQPILQYVFILISLGSLTAAFGLDGIWLILGVPLAQMAFWFALRRQSVGWRSACLLASQIATAAVGLLLGLAVSMLLIGTISALAAWDLLNFGETLRAARGAESSRRMAQSHFRSLFIALILGSLLSIVGLVLDLVVSFPMLAGLALVLVVSLVQAAGSIGIQEL